MAKLKREGKVAHATVVSFGKRKGFGFVEVPGIGNVFFNRKWFRDPTLEQEMKSGLKVKVRLAANDSGTGYNARDITPIHY